VQAEAAVDRAMVRINGSARSLVAQLAFDALRAAVEISRAVMALPRDSLGSEISNSPSEA